VVLYQHNRDELERFGFVIAGHDLRHVLFHVLYENRKDLLQQPFAIAQAVCKKGDELCEYAKTMLVEHNDWFAPEERWLESCIGESGLLMILALHLVVRELPSISRTRQD